MHRSACGTLSASLLLALAATSVQAQDGVAPAPASMVHCGHLFDSASGRLLGETSILVRGERAEEPGHDLTYLAESGLVTGTALPPTLFADMGGALLASEAVLQAALRTGASHTAGIYREVALNAAADWLALPRTWGLTTPAGAVGGAHAGYRVYPCVDGRVAIAALEPHFAARLCEAAGLAPSNMLAPEPREAIARWIAARTRAELEAMARERDVPLFTLAG